MCCPPNTRDDESHPSVSPLFGCCQFSVSVHLCFFVSFFAGDTNINSTVDIDNNALDNAEVPSNRNASFALESKINSNFHFELKVTEQTNNRKLYFSLMDFC